MNDQEIERDVPNDTCITLGKAFLKYDPNIHRAGVIPFTVVNGSFHFLLGRHTATMEFTDFGGGVKHSEKKKETPMDAAIREFREETNHYFDKGMYNDINYFSRCICVYKKIQTKRYISGMIILFVYIDHKYYCEQFISFQTGSHLGTKRSLEIDGMKWFSERAFCDMIFNINTYHSYRMWDKVSLFLKPLFYCYELLSLLKKWMDKRMY